MFRVSEGASSRSIGKPEVTVSSHPRPPGVGGGIRSCGACRRHPFPGARLSTGEEVPDEGVLQPVERLRRGWEAPCGDGRGVREGPAGAAAGVQATGNCDGVSERKGAQGAPRTGPGHVSGPRGRGGDPPLGRRRGVAVKHDRLKRPWYRYRYPYRRRLPADLCVVYVMLSDLFMITPLIIGLPVPGTYYL